LPALPGQAAIGDRKRMIGQWFVIGYFAILRANNITGYYPLWREERY